MNALPDTYHDVDAASDPSQLIDYLDRLADSATGRAYKRATYDLLQLSDAGAVLDVGCGTGDDARAIAMLAGPHTRVVGVDVSARMIAEARGRTTAGTPEFVVADVTDLDEPDGTFDAVRADRVLQHVASIVDAVREMPRVTRGGGRIVLADVDGRAGGRVTPPRRAAFVEELISPQHHRRRWHRIEHGPVDLPDRVQRNSRPRPRPHAVSRGYRAPVRCRNSRVR